MPNVMPEIPNFNDGEARLQWDFHNCWHRGRRKMRFLSRSRKEAEFKPALV